MNGLEGGLARQVVVGADEIDFVRVFEERIPFAGERPLPDQFLGAPGVCVGRSGNVAPLVAGVDLEAIVDLAAQQLVDRYAELLADDVPQRDVDRGNRRLHRAAVHRVSAAEDRVPDLLDVPRALAHDERPDHLDLGRDRRHLRKIRAFAPPDVAVGRFDAAHQTELTAGAALFVASEAHDVGFDRGDLQLAFLDRASLIQYRVGRAPGPGTDSARALADLRCARS